MSVLKRFVVVLSLATLGACASTSGEKASGPVASVNANFVVDNTKAQAGGEIYRQKACFVCHTIGGFQAGGDVRGTAPDLGGVVERREIAWLKQFLSNTTDMLESDPIAHALYVQYNMAKMPNFRLREEQIDNLINYLQQQTEKKRAS